MPSPAPPLGGPFWTLLGSSALSNLADGALKVALPLMAVALTTSPVLVSGLGVALSLPWLLFALPSGALSDRLDRRRVMGSANAVRACALLLLAGAALGGGVSIWLLYAVGFVIGTAETLYDTSAQSILPQLIHRDQLPRANGRLFAVELTAGQFIGPPLGGALVAGGAALAAGGAAALWLAAGGLLLLLPGSYRMPRTGTTSMRAEVAEGLRFLWASPVLRVLALMVGVFNFAFSAAFAIFVLHAVGPSSALKLSEVGYAVLLAMLAVGSVAGALVAERIQGILGRSRSLALTIPASAVLVLVPALTDSLVLIGATYVLGGLAIAVWNVISVSLRQRITSDRLLGRVNSGFRLMAWGTMPLGAGTGGLLADVLGIEAVFVLMGVLTMFLLVGLLVLTDTTIDAAERGTDGSTGSPTES
ncbi:MFS transporter [Arthrobacter sp. MDT3-44]